MKLLKFNESDNFFKIKEIIDNLNGILVEFHDNEIEYVIEPSNDIRVKLVSLKQINYNGFYLEIIPKIEYSDLIIDRINMVVDYMDSEDFTTDIKIFYYNSGRLVTNNVDINSEDFIKFFPRIKDINLTFNKKNTYISESLPSDKTIDQLKKVMNVSKSTDIGNRISDMNKQGANIDYIHNPIETGIESREDYEKHNKKFIPSWNLKHLKGPFHPEPIPKVKYKMNYKKKQ